MTESAASPTVTRPGTVWKRALGMFVVCMVAVGVLAFALIVGVIPIQLTLSKNPFQITLGAVKADKLDAHVGVSPEVRDGRLAGMNLAVEGGLVDDLCMSTTLDLPIVDQLSILLRSGESESIPLYRIEAHAVAVDIGKATATGVTLGDSSGKGPPGNFGVGVNLAEDVHNVWADGRSIEVLSVQLRGLDLELKRGTHSCPRTAGK